MKKTLLFILASILLLTGCESSEAPITDIHKYLKENDFTISENKQEDDYSVYEAHKENFNVLVYKGKNIEEFTNFKDTYFSEAKKIFEDYSKSEKSNGIISFTSVDNHYLGKSVMDGEEVILFHMFLKDYDESDEFVVCYYDLKKEKENFLKSRTKYVNSLCS